MKRILGLFGLVLGLVLHPVDAPAWGANGHRFLTEAGVNELPPPLKTFFLNYLPRFKDIAATEPPGTHFLDIDYYPEFSTHTFPHDINVLLAKYGNTVVNANGTGPWGANTNYLALRNLFSNARTVADWTNLLTTAGALAHYVEDLHNPMHLADNYNGQLTGQTGIHSRYETTLIDYRLNAGLKLTNNPNAFAYLPTFLDAVFADIDLVYPKNSPLLAADLAAYAATGERSSTNYYQKLWDLGCSSFTPYVMQKGADMVASALYSAWREAGFPAPPGVTVSTNVFLRVVSGTPAGCRFSMVGDVGQKLEVQTSTNLVLWTSWSTVTNVDGHVEVVAPPASVGPASFIRARLVP